MKKILITGKGSYIGASFEKYLSQFGDKYSVDVLDMLDAAWREKDFSPYDSVFHVAGIAHQRETKENAHLYYEVNRDLAVEVAKKAKKEGAGHFVFLSSMSVYGKESGVITKDTIPMPKSNYGKSKLEAEELLRELECDTFKVALVRPPMVYGKDCKGNYNLLKKMALKFPVFPDVDNERSMIYIGNLCEFIKQAIDNEDGGIFFPQNKLYVNTSNMVLEICANNRKKIHLTKWFNWAFPLVNLVTKKAEKAFGTLIYQREMSEYRSEYSIVSFEDSIKFTEEKDIG